MSITTEQLAEWREIIEPAALKGENVSMSWMLAEEILDEIVRLRSQVDGHQRAWAAHDTDCDLVERHLKEFRAKVARVEVLVKDAAAAYAGLPPDELDRQWIIAVRKALATEGDDA